MMCDISNKRFGTVLVINKQKRGWMVRCDCGKKSIKTHKELLSLTKSCGMKCDFKSHIGKIINNFKIIKKAGTAEDNQTLYLAVCKCGNQFSQPIHVLKRIRSCSRRCPLFKFPSKDFSGKKINNLYIDKPLRKEKHRVIYKCICDCGNIVEKIGSDVVCGKVKSCGCLLYEYLNGPRNPLYQGGLSKIPGRHVRGGPGYSKWIRSIKKLGNFSCLICKTHHKDNKHLQAHHLNNYVDFPEERTNIENGVCLCASCHRKFHNEYGPKTTRAMFLEYSKKLGFDFVENKS